MVASHADWALETFIDLERRMGDVLRVVPYEPIHMRTYSPVLASILLDSCSLTESILKLSMDNVRYNSVASITSLRAKRYSGRPPYLNINDLRTVFRQDQFYEKKIWLLPRGAASLPWYTWRYPGTKNPKWWTAYNNTKHDRFGNARKATLNHTIHAMKGCFLALVSSLDFRERLVERAIIRSPKLSAHALKPRAAQWEPLSTPELVVASTRLFAYKIRTQGHPREAADITIFL